jgi:quinoprotein glucose dehydrogenase
VIAVDPASGAERWKFDPHVNRAQGYSEVTSRGVAQWLDPQSRRRRIFIGTIDARLIALDAQTGKPCDDFGSHGQVDLTGGIDLRDRGDYQITSPPAIAGGLVIVGSSIGDNRAVDVERGVVRAFDARSGGLRWSWDPIPWAKDSSPRTGAANAWSVFSVDAARDLVFVPTGSAAPDFYGGRRPGDNRWANSVVALRASTGELVWGFQVVHHDLWDYDVASQPVLFTWRGSPAVAITTKMGHVFVLDRVTGKPLVPVDERKVPPSDVPGEEAWPTQPFSSLPLLTSQRLTTGDAWCRERIASVRNDGLFTPPGLRETIIFPGNVGGVNWGSAAIDAARPVLVANTNNVPFVVRLIPRDKLAGEMSQAGNRIGGEFARQAGTPYGVYRQALLSPAGAPCSTPPWGTTVAVDLEAGKKLWEADIGINLGGPIITAGGLVFTAAARDPYLRALDIDSGRELWKAELPASAQATPMTYLAGGKQYLVICAGGHGKLGSKQGDHVVAFALP